MKDINDMPPLFTKDEWTTEVDETEGPDLPEMPILTVTVHDEDETNKFQYKVYICHLESFLPMLFSTLFKNKEPNFKTKFLQNYRNLDQHSSR